MWGAVANDSGVISVSVAAKAFEPTAGTTIKWNCTPILPVSKKANLKKMDQVTFFLGKCKIQVLHNAQKK